MLYNNVARETVTVKLLYLIEDVKNSTVKAVIMHYYIW
jgi:hypothetical protein